MLSSRVSRIVAITGLLFSSAACVNVDPDTGRTLPRGNQRYEFSRVERDAERLAKGMTKRQVLLLLGSPAEKDDRGDTWVYLPERPGILIPAKALKLSFRWDELAEWGYHAIVLGQRL